MKIIRWTVLFGTLVVFLYVVNTGIMTSERHIAEGTVAYLELAPVDPRSLIQGDYMQLDYAIEHDIRIASRLSQARHGQVVLTLDADRVAHYARRYRAGQTLAPNEVVINFYRVGQHDVRIGVESFLFQEGRAHHYAAARYAEIRIIEGGGVLLVDLADENWQALTFASADES